MAVPLYEDPRLLQTRTTDTPVTPVPPRDLAGWLARRTTLRTQILAAAGLWDDPATTERTPPVAEIFERTTHPDLGYSVEKVYFESLPGHLVTGNLYRPAGPAHAPARRAAILNPHGHWATGRLHHDERGSTAARCITFARSGYIAFCHDMTGHADSTAIPHRWGSAATWLWGASPLGLQLYNCIRALDFLAALPDVDPERLGCTGESGGGTQTFLLTAVDPRVRVAAPVNMVSAHFQGGCVCENAPGLRLEASNVEFAAMCAPRPLLLVSASGDWTVNTPTVEYPAVAAVYRLFGHEERLSTVQVDAPHNYNRQSREAVYAFFARWLPPLADRAGPLADEDGAPDPDPDPDLRVFARRPAPEIPQGEAAIAAVLRWFQDTADAGLRRDVRDAAGRAHLLACLQAVTGVAPVPPGTVEAREMDGWILLRRAGCAERFALAPVTTEAERAAAELVLVATDGRAYALWPFGASAGDRPWADGGRAADAPFFLCYNRADAAWRAQDVLTALTWLGGAASTLVARGTTAVPALLARAVAGAAVGHLEVELGPRWSGDGDDDPWLTPAHYLPGIARAGGLAGLIALGTPAPLRLHLPPGPARDALGTACAALGAGGACELV